MNVKRALILALLALPLIVALFAGFGRDPHAVPFVLQGKPAPAFVLADVTGQTTAVPDPNGLPTLVNFWATWCYPCQAEHALLQETARVLEGRVRVVGVIYNDSVEAVTTYVRQNGGAYPQLIDPNSRVAINYGVAGVPESFIIDGNGTIVHKQAGVLAAAVIEHHLLPLVRK